MQPHHRFVAAVGAASMILAGLAFVAAPAGANTATVTNGDDAGQGSFRAAVEAANANAAIDTITFAGGVTVSLSSEVAFTGDQDLTIDGLDATISGTDVSPDTVTWDSGLFVKRDGAGDLTLRRLHFTDSFDNGVGVFLPADTADPFNLTLDRVSVTGTQFHGVLVDGQSTTGYNTDDVIHTACADPHPIDVGVTIDLHVDRTAITDAGRLNGGYDLSLATGCPQDFDGLRVDQGGAGDLTGSITRSTFDDNLADGVELDETGNGGVDVAVDTTSFTDNGDTQSIPCDVEAVCGDSFGETITDLDDGFDIDEAGDGDLAVSVSRSTVNRNWDEGLDMDEAGEGDVIATLDRVTATDNTDEGFKSSELDEGDTFFTMSRSTTTDGTGGNGVTVEEDDDSVGDVNVHIERSTLAGHAENGLEVDEAGTGNVTITIDRTTITGNTEDGVNADEDNSGSGTLVATRSDFRGNGESGLDLDDVVATLVKTHD